VIRYTSSIQNVTVDQLSGFFVGWPDPPTPDEHLELLHSSYRVVLARIDGGRVIGYATAISDGVLNAHIPLLEVLPEFQRLGVGTELMRQMLVHLNSFYAIDLICDSVHKTFYERLDFAEATGMIIRRTR
jgi:ribosomal protein S18 acetylase RimI-like enzyme